MNKQKIADALNYGFPTDKIKIRYNNASLTFKRNQMTYDLDFINKTLCLVISKPRKYPRQYLIATKYIKGIRVTTIPPTTDPVAEVGEI